MPLRLLFFSKLVPFTIHSPRRGAGGFIYSKSSTLILTITLLPNESYTRCTGTPTSPSDSLFLAAIRETGLSLTYCNN